MQARHAEVVDSRPALVPPVGAVAAPLRRRGQPPPSTARPGCLAGGRRRLAAASAGPTPCAYARWREAEARLAARGHRDVASAALREAHEIASRLSAIPLAREIEALATRARLDLSPDESPAGVASGEPDEGADFGLTAREREVLGLSHWVGRTARSPTELFISENTAGVHVSNILGKLAVSSRGEAAAVAYRLGLADASQVAVEELV